MLDQRRKRRLSGLGVILGVIVIDQLSKTLFRQFVSLNAGISFGWQPFHYSIVLGLALLSLFGLTWFSWLGSKHTAALSLLLGGGLSNFLDRLIYHGVRDFIRLPWLGLQNNLADWAIVVGVVYLVILVTRDRIVG